ncbi:MAG: DNA mismatch repair endonuclease MutL [Desulfuromonadales bacterium]|nr:DNA mismatch repair endonuclease MutL [Desulfuromonadales bacterium]
MPLSKRKINILPEQLCNQIAAGEVVERPASVVKELIENSLDADASEIRVEVESGGKKLILVADDGVGMGREDLLLSLERHATSKISSEADLFRLGSLGFRGEALPSIASVSRMRLRSRLRDELAGHEVYLEGGIVKRCEEVGTPHGTTIEIRDLFFNTPARRKFLRRDETELSHISDIITKLALANPAVQFQLAHNGRVVLELYRHRQLRERVVAVLGRKLAPELLELQPAAADTLRLSGLLARPNVDRSTPAAVYTYINGRFVQDRTVRHAVLEGYRGVLMKGRYPVAVIFLEIDPALVDVNVHPAKSEVRFRDQRLVHDFIVSSVRDRIRDERTADAPVHPWLATNPPHQTASEVPSRPDTASAPDLDRSAAVQESLASYARQMTAHAQGNRSAFSAPPGQPAPPAGLSSPPPLTQYNSAGFFAGLKIIGQYRRSYLLCEDAGDLVIIDQHAAHERIGFEALRAQFNRGQIEQLGLLVPVMVEFDHKGAALLNEYLPELERFGFDVEPFGGTTFAVKGTPSILHEADFEKLLLDLVAELDEAGGTEMLLSAVEQVLVTIACHRVVRANQKLSEAEMRALLRQLDEVDFSQHCPHGRPVIHRVSGGDVERFFRRT